MEKIHLSVVVPAYNEVNIYLNKIILMKFLLLVMDLKTILQKLLKILVLIMLD